jgi:hypothetical protein
MNTQELLSKIAHLESVNDQLMTELSYVDELMKKVGFTDGLATVKATAEEISNGELQEFEDEEDDAMGF